MDSSDQVILISYTHDSPEHGRRVLELSDRLLQDGVDSHLDQYETSPPEGWPRWMRNQVANAKFVLVVCTETYQQRFDGHQAPGKGLGAQWEGDIITQDLYDNASRNTKFIPILFSEEDAEYIPSILRGATHYRVDRDEGYEDLYRRLTAQPKIEKPPLGKRRVLQPLNEVVGTEAISITDVASQTAAPRKPNTVETNAGSRVNLTLLFLSEDRFIFVPASRIEHSEHLNLELLPDDPRKTAFLRDFNNKFNRPEIAIAFRDIAIEGQLQKATTTHSEAGESWQIQIKPSADPHNSSLYDFAFNNYTPEDIAELRAKRILLNEMPPKTQGRDRLMDGLAESMINRSEGLIKQAVSPLPRLYQIYSNDTEYFLEAARLMCILYLKLTGTVEHIFKLNLKLTDARTVEVEFEGQRRARYTNESPHVIHLMGVCPLDKG